MARSLTLTDFLLARIAEVESVAEGMPQRDPGGQSAHALSARIRAECQAQRHIVEEFQAAERSAQAQNGRLPTPAYWWEWGQSYGLQLAVRYLAAVYADHPDYRDDWQPWQDVDGLTPPGAPNMPTQSRVHAGD